MCVCDIECVVLCHFGEIPVAKSTITAAMKMELALVDVPPRHQGNS